MGLAGQELALLCNAGIASGSFLCYATMPAPIDVFLNTYPRSEDFDGYYKNMN